MPYPDIIFNDEETIWSTSKSAPIFHQYDTASDSYALIDSMPQAGAKWTVEGELVFVDDARASNDIPWDS